MHDLLPGSLDSDVVHEDSLPRGGCPRPERPPRAPGAGCPATGGSAGASVRPQRPGGHPPHSRSRDPERNVSGRPEHRHTPYTGTRPSVVTGTLSSCGHGDAKTSATWPICGVPSHGRAGRLRRFPVTSPHWPASIWPPATPAERSARSSPPAGDPDPDQLRDARHRASGGVQAVSAAGLRQAAGRAGAIDAQLRRASSFHGVQQLLPEPRAAPGPDRAGLPGTCPRQPEGGTSVPAPDSLAARPDLPAAEPDLKRATVPALIIWAPEMCSSPADGPAGFAAPFPASQAS